MLRWLTNSFTGSRAPAGFDAAKHDALTVFETKTRAAYTLVMHGYPELAYSKLAQRPPLTPELIAYAKGPGAGAHKLLGQAMTALADVAGEVEVFDETGHAVSIKEQLARFRTPSRESYAR